MVPKAAKKPIPRTCLICKKKLASKEALVNHLEQDHSEQIPEDWSPARYENYLRTGITVGTCAECKKESSWNDATWKYNRLCNNPKCREAAAKRAKTNMKSKYGVEHLLNNPDMQRKMIYSKRHSGKYYFTTDTSKKYPILYASGEEKKFLEMLDVFLSMDASDILGPSPNTYMYKYSGKDRFYIPDFYIPSLNLEIEIKEPSNNQNTHPKIQAIDKVKEKLKDELMESIPQINYIKINGTEYNKFFSWLSYLKDLDEPGLKTYGRVLEHVAAMESGVNYGPHMVDMFNKMAQNTFDIMTPKLNYNTVIKNLEKQVKTCKRTDLESVERQLNQIEADLQDMLNNEDVRKTGENNYEGKKALDRIQNYIRPQFESRKKAILKLKVSMEQIDDYANSWYREDSETAVSESVITGIRDGIVYRPVFIVLTKSYSRMSELITTVTNQHWTHAAITFNTDMTRMASFNVHGKSNRGGGFIPDESFSDGYRDERAEYAVYMYLADNEEYLTMERVIDEFQRNIDKFKYSWAGLIDYLRKIPKTKNGEYFCSEFVVSVLRSANPKLFKRPSNHYSPTDLTMLRKFRLVDTGLIKQYNSHKVDILIKRILEKRGMQRVDIQ